MIAVGYLDTVTPDHVAGWCWFPEAPETRVDIEILFDNAVVATTAAGLYRDDLALAGIGDGRYGFSIRLGGLRSYQETAIVSARVKTTGQAVGQAKRVGNPFNNPLEPHLAKAEGDVASLSHEIKVLLDTSYALTDGSKTLHSIQAAADFVSAAATSRARGYGLERAVSQSALGQGILLRAILRQLSRKVAPSRARLALTPQPRLSLIVPAFDTETAIRDVASIISIAARLSAEVIILDHRADGPLALLPAVLTGVRYYNSSEGERFDAWATCIAAAHSNFVVFLTPNFSVSAGALNTVWEEFERNSRLGLLRLRKMIDGSESTLHIPRADEFHKEKRSNCSDKNDVYRLEKISAFAARRNSLREAGVLELTGVATYTDFMRLIIQRLALLGYDVA